MLNIRLEEAQAYAAKKVEDLKAEERIFAFGFSSAETLRRAKRAADDANAAVSRLERRLADSPGGGG